MTACMWTARRLWIGTTPSTNTWPVVRWQAGQRPLLRVLNRLQTDEQILRVDVPEESGWAHLTSIDEHTMPLLPVRCSRRIITTSGST